jgi:hypothetical protein
MTTPSMGRVARILGQVNLSERELCLSGLALSTIIPKGLSAGFRYCTSILLCLNVNS